MATFGYSLQALDRATEILARDEGDVRDRVRKAARDLCAMEADACPSSWRRDIRWIQRRLKSHRRKFFVEHTGSNVIGYDFSAAIQRQTTVKKIVERVRILSSKRMDSFHCKEIEAEQVELCEVGKSPYVQIECPQCRKMVRVKLNSTTTRRCSCNYRWRAEILGIGLKTRKSMPLHTSTARDVDWSMRDKLERIK